MTGSGGLKRRATVGAAWVAVETWAYQLVQFALFLILARLLGPEAYGLIGIALTINVVGEALIVEGGWAEALIQRRDLDRRHLDAVFWALLAVGVGLAVVAISGAWLLASIFARPEVAPLVVGLSLALPLYSLGVVPDALLRRELRFAPLAARSLAAILTAGAVGVAMASAGLGVWSLIGFHVVQPLVATLVVWRASGWRPTVGFSRAHLRAVMPFVGGMGGERAAVALDSLAARLVIGYVLGPAALGQYTVARKIVELANQLLTRPLTRVGVPSFAASAGSPERLRALLERTAQLGTAIACPSFVGLAVVAPDLVLLALGPQWLPSVPVIQILALLGLITPIMRAQAALMYGLGRAGAQFALGALATLLFLLGLATVQPSSLVAFAALIVARTYLVFPLRLMVVGRTTGIDALRPTMAALRPVAASLVMLAAVVGFRSSLAPELSPVALLLGSAAIGTAAYLAALLLVARPLLLQLVDLVQSVVRGLAAGDSFRPAGNGQRVGGAERLSAAGYPTRTLDRRGGVE